MFPPKEAPEFEQNGGYAQEDISLVFCIPQTQQVSQEGNF